MTPVNEQILVAFQAAIAGVTPNVARNKRSKVTQYPALVMYDGDEDFAYVQTQEASEILVVEVEGHVEADDDDAIGAALNLLLADLIVAATADTSLGNLATDVQIVKAERDFAQDTEKALGSFIATFEIQFGTAVGDPFTVR